MKGSTRATGIIAGAIATLAYPSWTAFDYLVEPESAGEILVLRLLMAIPDRRLLAAHVQPPGAPPPGAADARDDALPVSRHLADDATVETHYAAYALGMSLTVYGGAFLLIWSPAYMAALCGLSLAVLTTVLALSDPPTRSAPSYFYFVTACALSFLVQFYRERTAWRGFENLCALVGCGVERRVRRPLTGDRPARRHRAR